MGNQTTKSNQINHPNQNNLCIETKPSRTSVFDGENVDSYVLIWLDEQSSENTLDSLRTKALLRQLNNDHCLFFDNVDLFLNEIEKMIHDNKKILVVVSGSLAKTILPTTKETVSTIIIFCQNYNKYMKLMSQYENVADICTNHEALKNCIQREIPSLKLNMFVNQSLKSIQLLDSFKDSCENNGACFSYLLFIELLQQMPQTNQAKEVMVNKCKDYYRRNKEELIKIDLFHSKYESNEAINWYTEDSFVYRLVNKAFRTEDITLWYLFRFFIIDLCTQLKTVHAEQHIQDSLKLYRGQARMSAQELNNLRSSIGGCVITNGFLSTTKDIKIAHVFINEAKDTDEYKVVIFEITVNASQLKSVVFVDIDQYQQTCGEKEILFNIGSVFKIQNVIYDNDFKVWKIQMEATDERSQEIERRVDSMRKKFQNGNINLLFGRLLIDMGHLTKAESYFHMILQILPKDHEHVASVYDHIGYLNMRAQNWNEAYRNFRLAYDIKKCRLRSDHPSFGMTLNSIGNYYQAIGDYTEAQNYYSKALLCKNDQHSAAITTLNIGQVLAINGEFENALRLVIEARDSLQQTMPYSQPELISCQGILGDIYFVQRNYIAAEQFYLTAFELSKKFLFIGDRGRTTCIKAMVDLHKQQGKIEQAMEFCREQLTLHEVSLGENHWSIAHLLIKMGELQTDSSPEKFHILKRALHIMERSVHLNYATTATCLIMVAECYVRANQYDKASMCYMRALEIQEKIYPANHRIIMQTKTLLDGLENKIN